MHTHTVELLYVAKEIEGDTAVECLPLSRALSQPVDPSLAHSVETQMGRAEITLRGAESEREEVRERKGGGMCEQISERERDQDVSGGLAGSSVFLVNFLSAALTMQIKKIPLSLYRYLSLPLSVCCKSESEDNKQLIMNSVGYKDVTEKSWCTCTLV